MASDDAYTDLLKSDSSLSLMECLWLDAVRRHKPITKEAAKHLRERNLIEGKSPRYNIALSVAQKTKQVSHYTKETGLNKTAKIKLILQLADNAGAKGFKRAMAFEILEQSLPAGMNKSQKLNLLTHLLMEINELGFIIKSGSGKSWVITEEGRKYLNS